MSTGFIKEKKERKLIPKNELRARQRKQKEDELAHKLLKKDENERVFFIVKLYLRGLVPYIMGEKAIDATYFSAVSKLAKFFSVRDKGNLEETAEYLVKKMAESGEFDEDESQTETEEKS